VGLFGLGNGTFDSDMIDLHVIIMTLSLGVKVNIGTSGNCEDCAMGGEGVGLLRRFLVLRWRRRWWIDFGFDLRVDIVWHWVCNLWYWGWLLVWGSFVDFCCSEVLELCQALAHSSTTRAYENARSWTC
jgi:hypothetical protein